MSAPVPPLAEFLRWMAEMPPPFRAEPEGYPKGTVRVRAVVADLVETTFGDIAAAALLEAFLPQPGVASDRNRLRWVLAACHLLWHPALRARPVPRTGFERFLVQELAQLGAVVASTKLEVEEERREELVRRALRALELTLPGESAKDAEDRLDQVDSLENRRLLKEAAERERKAKREREVREQMARKAAEEAAAKTSRD